MSEKDIYEQMNDMYRHFRVKGSFVPDYETTTRGGALDEVVAPLERQSPSKLRLIARTSEDRSIRDRASRLYYERTGASADSD